MNVNMVTCIITKIYRTVLQVLACSLLSLLGCVTAYATCDTSASVSSSISICADSTSSLQQALKAIYAGGEINLEPGKYQGSFSIDKAVTLIGQEGVVFDAQGTGSALIVNASRVTIEKVTITNWGADLYEKDAAINVKPNADYVNIIGNRLIGAGFGVYANGVNHITIENNQIIGDEKAYLLDRGDGVHLLKVDYPVVHANKIHYVRDGVYLESGVASQVTDNQVYQAQYGLHYMYTKQDKAENNQANRVTGGYALMSSESIHLAHNRVVRAQEFGVLLNLTKNANIESNQISSTVMLGGVEGDLFSQGKGIFAYGARDNQISNNYIANNEIGIAMALGGEGNQVFRNQFIDNTTQVRYVGDKRVEWSFQGQGNYWSDYSGWDLDGDSVGDSHHLPNDRLDRLFWLYPEAMFLMESPVVKLLKWLDNQVQKEIAIGVVDSFPMMTPNHGFMKLEK